MRELSTTSHIEKLDSPHSKRFIVPILSHFQRKSRAQSLNLRLSYSLTGSALAALDRKSSHLVLGLGDQCELGLGIVRRKVDSAA
jgi:hypothetical protein